MAEQCKKRKEMIFMALGVEVNYFDPAGNSKKGYIIDNKTYKDPEGKERVELGSVVETADGSYTLTKNGGVKTNVLGQYYNKAGKSILSSKNDAEMAIRSDYAMQKNRIENYKREAKRDYEKAVANQNRQKLLSEKNMAQKLKAQGINGGVSESALIANDIVYEQNINELGERLDKALSGYDNDLIELSNKMNSEILSSNSEYDSIYADFLVESAKMVNDDLNVEKQLNSENFRFNQEYNRGLYEDERDYERGIFESDREYALEDEKNKRAVYEDERDYERSVYEDERDYERSVYEDERDYERNVYEDERDYERNVYEDERDYERNVYEDNRDYNRGVLESDRNYSKSTSGGKGSSSSKDDKEYDRALKRAQELAKFGDYSALAEFYDWTPEQLEKAENEYYFK